jgi:hypothetical protein
MRNFPLSSKLLWITSISTIILLAAANLILPLDRDQSFFLYAAQHIKSGSILYKDIWDAKQPGIFLFYLAAGELFGYSEWGVHLLECFWMAAQCVVVAWWAPKIGVSSWFSCLAPLFTVGAYYAAAWTWHLTQVEALVGLPLLLAGGLALSTDAYSKRRLLAAGAAGGIVLIFKAMLCPVLVAMWAVACIFRVKKEATSPLRTALVFIALIGTGCAVPVIAVAVWASHSGFLPEMVFATFVFPLKFAASESHYHFYPTFRIAKTFFQALGWFLIRFGPLLFLASIGAKDLIKRNNEYAIALVAWLVSASVVFIAQTWWGYQLLLLLPPLGLLAVVGVEWLFLFPGKRRFLRFAAMGITAIAFAVPAYAKFESLALHGVIPMGENRLLYQMDVLQKWQKIVDETRFLDSPGAAPGPIYVREGSLYWLASGRELVYPADHGYQLPEQRVKWPVAIMSAAPVYMRLPREDREVINSIDSKFQKFLDENYIKMEGKPPWYKRVKYGQPKMKEGIQ